MNYEPRTIVVNSGSGTATVSLVIAGRGAVAYDDTGDTPLSGVVTLLSGAKYNVNGTWQATRTPGMMRAVYLCQDSNMQLTNDKAEVLYDLAGRSGTLYGYEYNANNSVSHNCQVVVESARPISMMDKVGASIGRAHAIQVEVVFNRLTEWS
jgi:hypothetical protein